MHFRSMEADRSIAEMTAEQVSLEEEEEEEEEERVVYYDLDDTARRSRTLVVPPVDVKKSKRSAATADRPPPKQRVLTTPTQLFTNHAVLVMGGRSLAEEDGDQHEHKNDHGIEEDDDDDDDASNPFAALLQIKEPAPTCTSLGSRPATRRSPVRRVTPPSPPSPPEPTVSSLSSVRQTKPPRAQRSLSPAPSFSSSPELPPRATRTTPPVSRHSVGSFGSRRSLAATTTTTRPLVPTIEAADARPSRWTRQPPAGGATKRRQSTSSTALAKQQAEAKRRKSLPASMSSLEDSNQRHTATGARRLSDVLSKATLLSQDRRTTSTSAADHSFNYSEPVRETDDGIADTVKEMRDEPFQTQFFSPSKLRNGGTSSHRKPRADAVLAKIRGSLGDAIRKATRKTNRDLTLLRSQGQTLLGRADQDSAGEIHCRDFVVVQLERLVPHPHLITYDGIVQDLRLSRDHASEGVPPTEGLRLTIVFSASDVTQQLACGSSVKIFAPFQVVDECCAPGVRRRRRKFLMGTSLFELASTDP